MAKEKKQEEEIKTDGWMATFSDLMNLLLCFFVLLFAMSNVDEVKYAELVASLSNSFSIFSGGMSSLGEGSLISSGATQLSNLDQYYTDMGKAADSESESDPESEAAAKKQSNAETTYSDVVEAAERARVVDDLDVKMDAEGYNYVMLSLSGGILFESGSANIQAGAKNILSRVASILQPYERQGRRIKIEGHTDNIPIKNSAFKSNLWLSTARATTVLEYLQERMHTRGEHLEASGRGELDPVASNETASGRAKNRRVEIKIYTDTE